MNGVDSVSVNPFSKICAVEAGNSIGTGKQIFFFFFFRKTLPLTSFDMFDSIGIYLKGKSVSKRASKRVSERARK